MLDLNHKENMTRISQLLILGSLCMGVTIFLVLSKFFKMLIKTTKMLTHLKIKLCKMGLIFLLALK